MTNKDILDNPWSIWIDVEGFSTLYATNSKRAKLNLGFLMEALYKVGSLVFNRESERLFIHQFGDGFAVISDFQEDEPTRPLTICIAIMRHLLKKGVATKAAISAGDFADISGCYPKEVMSVATDGRWIKIGDGLMTIVPVMGMALISAHKLADTDTGALLLLDSLAFSKIPEGAIVRHGTAAIVDWVHSTVAGVEEICKKSGLENVTAMDAEAMLTSYIDANKVMLSKKWIERTIETLSIKGI